MSNYEVDLRKLYREKPIEELVFILRTFKEEDYTLEAINIIYEINRERQGEIVQYEKELEHLYSGYVERVNGILVEIEKIYNNLPSSQKSSNNFSRNLTHYRLPL